VKFLVDNQLPIALARFIHYELEVEAAHVADLGLRGAADAELWQYASLTGAVLISKDEDFVGLALQAPTACLLWVRLGNCRRGELLDVFGRVWPKLIEKLASGERIIELRARRDT